MSMRQINFASVGLTIPHHPAGGLADGMLHRTIPAHPATIACRDSSYATRPASAGAAPGFTTTAGVASQQRAARPGLRAGAGRVDRARAGLAVVGVPGFDRGAFLVFQCRPHPGPAVATPAARPASHHGHPCFPVSPVDFGPGHSGRSGQPGIPPLSAVPSPAGRGRDSSGRHRCRRAPPGLFLSLDFGRQGHSNRRLTPSVRMSYRQPNGSLHEMAAGAALHPVSWVWMGYWQR